MHIEFLAENGDLAQHEVDALNAFDLYKPKQPSRAVQFLAKIRKAAEATTKEPREGPPPAPQTEPTATVSQPVTPARVTRTGSGILPRAHHGIGSPGDEEMALRMHEREVDGKGSPPKPPTSGSRPKPNAANSLGLVFAHRVA